MSQNQTEQKLDQMKDTASSVGGKIKGGVQNAMNNMNMNSIGLDDTKYFDTDTSKMNEIKKLLDSNSDKEKMEGMKRLIALISKGRDMSLLFPDVVKNVVCKNLEIRKLVYMYLVHYAELEPDTALLSINTFQKALLDQNQLIRALGLRVMSSIRVLDIVQLILMAIKQGVKDSSPYVRKTAAHAISKVYRLDPEQKNELIELIEDLLKDKSTMVLGSAIAAFTEVCPERDDLIGPIFKKLCRLLADIDEWGQIIVLELLLRFGRSQFTDPDPEGAGVIIVKDENFYGDEEDDQLIEDDDAYSFKMEADHRLLLDAASPLLQSRNSGVVTGVASLYYYLAPAAEVDKVGKALVRLLRSHKEIQFVVLSNIASMASTKPAMFESQLQEFFISPSDPLFVRDIKLEILTYLANESNTSKILQEFNQYVHFEDKDFVSATVQAIGRCALQIPAVTERCMRTLMRLISHQSEIVVAESVVVIKRLLQMIGKNIDMENQLISVVTHLAVLFDTVKVGLARASIVWVIGQYTERVPTIGPDILRKCCKTFIDEEDITKLQILSLGSKLHLTNPNQTTNFFLHILNLAKFDVNYDIRDRTRLLRTLVVNREGKVTNLHQNTRRLIFAEKPTPVESRLAEDRKRFILGSLSHMLNQTANSYLPLPEFPEIAVDASFREEEAAGIYDNTARSDQSQFGGENFYENNHGVSENGIDYGNSGYESYGQDEEDFYEDNEYYDEEGEFYDQEGGQYYDDEGGQYYDDEGGEYYDDEGGEYYDEEGEYYDEEGEYYDEEGEYYDEEESGSIANGNTVDIFDPLANSSKTPSGKNNTDELLDLMTPSDK